MFHTLSVIENGFKKVVAKELKLSKEALGNSMYHLAARPVNVL